MRTLIRTRLFVCAAVAAALVLGATNSQADESAPGIGCGWSLKLSPEKGLNVGWPDNRATYWYANYVAIPGTRLVIRGSYSRARFFVIDVYDSKLNPVPPGFLDRFLIPDPGSVNPFTTEGVEGDQDYTSYVRIHLQGFASDLLDTGENYRAKGGDVVVRSLPHANPRDCSPRVGTRPVAMDRTIAASDSARAKIPRDVLFRATLLMRKDGSERIA